jgi:hypothetical protein
MPTLWNVEMLRREDGHFDLTLVVDGHRFPLDALEAHKLGSALHAAAERELSDG